MIITASQEGYEQAKLSTLKGCICTALFVVGSCVAARAELAIPSGKTVVVASPAYIGGPLADAVPWDDDARHGLLGHEGLDNAAGEPLLMAQKATSLSKTQREAEQAIEDFMDEALVAARNIADAGDRVTALTSIARAQAKAGDTNRAGRSISEALTAARKIGDASRRALAFRSIAEAQMEVGDAQGAAWSIPEALTAAWSISKAGDRARELGHIAKLQMDAGDRRSATQSISEAMAIARSIEDAYYRASAFSRIAVLQVETGDRRSALRTISDAMTSVQNIKDAFSSVLALTSIAVAQTKVGDTRGAARSISEALTNARSLAGAGMRVTLVGIVAQKQAWLGDTRGAARSISEALTIARSEQFTDVRNISFKYLAQIQANTGDIQGALASVRSIGNGFDHTEALSAIARAQVKAGHIQDALMTAQDIADSSVRTAVFGDIARVQMEAGDARGAVRSISEALTNARGLEDASERALALSTIAPVHDNLRRQGELFVDDDDQPASQPATLNAGASPAPSPKKLQSALTALGFNPGPADGKIGPKTRAAIEQWQETVGQEPTGTLDAAQQTALVNSAFGEQAGQEEQSSAQETSTSGNTTPSDTFAGGCAERMNKMGSDIGAVSKAMKDYIRRMKNGYGFSACGSFIIGYNVTLNYVEALRRCPESDPTGEQLAQQETRAEEMGARADIICSGIDSRQRHSMKDLLDLLTSFTPLDQWKNGGQGRTEHWQDETVDQRNQGSQGRSEQRNQDDQGRPAYRRYRGDDEVAE